MKFFLIKCVFLFFAAAAVFSQNEERAQGLITPEPFWRQALGGAVLSLPHVQAQSAVVALDGGNIKAYSTAGTPMWNFSARGRISPYVTRSREGTSYFSRTNGILIAVNRAGRELWRRNLGSPLAAKVVSGWDSRLFVPVDKKIFCYTASGNLLWTRTLESSFSIAPKLDRSGGIFFALENNQVYRIDPFGNFRIWTLSNTPAALLSIERQQILVLYTDGTLGILGQTEDWFFSAQGEVHSSLLPRLPSQPVAAAARDNKIAVVFNDGRVSLVSLEERKILWSGDSHILEFTRTGRRPEPEVEVLLDERGIYILSKNGATGFSHDGRRLWFTFLQNTAAIPAFGNDGVLYSGGRDWILYAYKIEDRILHERQTLYGPEPEGSYGTGHIHSSLLPNIPYSEWEIQNRLGQIDSALKAGNVGINELSWISILMTIVTGEYNFRFKITALHLLGQLGSQETIPWLTNIFRRENDSSVKAAAAHAIGAIGVDPHGNAIQTFLNTLIQGGGIRDEQVLTAIAAATGALCRFSGPPLSETGVRILTMLSASNQPPVARRQANRELASLR
jgi:outer membrane protein assembly factor BamB